MPFQTRVVYVPGNKWLLDELRFEPFLKGHIYWIPKGSLPHCILPEEGLIAIRELENPRYYKDGLTWDKFKTANRTNVFLPNPKYDRLMPPRHFFEYWADLAEHYDTSVFYYSISTHGGDTIDERVGIVGNYDYWLSYEDQISSGSYKMWIDGKRTTVHGSFLYFGMKEIGVQIPLRGYFHPHERTFDWECYKVDSLFLESK